jgi:hypothetical protein
MKLTSIENRQANSLVINNCSSSSSGLSSPSPTPHDLVVDRPHAEPAADSELPITDHQPIKNQHSIIKNGSDLPGFPSPLTDSLIHNSSCDPWSDPVDGRALLDDLTTIFERFVILPKWAHEALALWTLHTYAFHLRDVTTYIGLESPEKRCGKTTLLSILLELVNRPVVAANISSPAFFRVIEEIRPTLLIDEADTLLQGNDELRGILNAGYHRRTAYVVRVIHRESTAPGEPSCPEQVENQKSKMKTSALGRFSSWCPKVLAAIGHLPDTLADRCILIRMHRKTMHEQCDRLRDLHGHNLKRQCLRFVLDHSEAIAAARPQVPRELNDRAADIWEPLLALADLAGDRWPELARQSAINLTANAQDQNPLASLLLDIFILFHESNKDRLFSRDILQHLNGCLTRPWRILRNGREINDIWLSQQLRPYGIKPRNIVIGGVQAKGYLQDDLLEICRRYLTKGDIDALRALPETQPSPPSESDEPSPHLTND